MVEVENLRLVPRPFQQHSPPRWTTVVSTESARRSAQRGSKICTSFHPVERIRHIFDAFRDEAQGSGGQDGPDQLAIRRTISIDEDEGAARAASREAAEALRAVLAHDPRVTQHPLPDAPGPGAQAFLVGEEEFIAGTGERGRTDHRAVPRRRRRSFPCQFRPREVAGGDAAQLRTVRGAGYSVTARRRGVTELAT